MKVQAIGSISGGTFRVFRMTVNGKRTTAMISTRFVILSAEFSEEILIRGCESVTQRNSGEPAGGFDQTDIAQFARRSVRHGWIVYYPASESYHFGDQFSHVSDTDFFATADVDQIRRIRQLQQMQNSGRQVIDMQEFSQRCP